MYNSAWSPRLTTWSPIHRKGWFATPMAILRGGFVGASIARPQDSAPSRPHPTACGVLPTDPVWARRPKPTRPAETERPPLSFGTPHAEEPQGSWSPDFSVRVVTQTRGGAGRKQNGLPRQLAGVPAATQTLQSFYFSCKGPKPAATQGLPRGREWASLRRMVPPRLFLSPPSFLYLYLFWGMKNGVTPRSSSGGSPPTAGAASAQ